MNREKLIKALRDIVALDDFFIGEYNADRPNLELITEEELADKIIERYEQED